MYPEKFIHATMVAVDEGCMGDNRWWWHVEMNWHYATGQLDVPNGGDAESRACLVGIPSFWNLCDVPPPHEVVRRFCFLPMRAMRPLYRR